VIVDFAGRAVNKVRELQRLVAGTRPGTPVQVKVLRDQQERFVALEVGELKESDAKPEPAASRFGLTLEALTRELARQLNLKIREGVIIANVEEGSLAAREGLRKGDVILEVERTPVASLGAFQETVSKLKPHDDILLLILREDRSFYSILHAPRG